MKGQSEGQSVHRPSAVLATPGSRPLKAEDQENLREETERIMRREELDRRNVDKGNRVAQLLAATYYILDKTFPFLTFKNRQLSVTEYYPLQKIAVDKFYFGDPINEQEIEFKRTQFKANGIKYSYLTPKKRLADLAEDLGIE